MTNRRMITSDIWEDDFFTSLNIFGRLLWMGIITTCADDQGRLQDNASLIRSKVFPLDDIPTTNIEAALSSFNKERKIVRYVANGKRLIQIVNWWKHQTPSWASASKYPAPHGWTDREKYHTVGNKIASRNWDMDGGFVSLPSQLPSQLPSSLNESDVKSEDDVKSEEEGEEEAPAAASLDLEADLFMRVTGMPTIPGKKDEAENARDVLRVIRSQHKGDAAVFYLQPFYRAWKDRHYAPSNTAWLTEWAVSGEIPQPRNGTGNQSTRVLTDPSGNTIEVPA